VLADELTVIRRAGVEGVEAIDGDYLNDLIVLASYVDTYNSATLIEVARNPKHLGAGGLLLQRLLRLAVELRVLECDARLPR